MSKKLLLFLFFMGLVYSSWGQAEHNKTIKNPTFVGLSLDYAYILQHTSSLREIGDAYPTGISLDWSKLLVNKKAWEFCNCFPRLGVELSYWDFDKRDILGSGIIALGYAEPYFRTQKKTNLFFRLGLGGTYLTEPFDEQTNPLNNTYSTHLSLVIMAGIGINYQISNEWNLRMLAKYNHTSNGGINTPNKGINFPNLSLGVAKSLNPVSYPDYQKIESRQAPENKERISLTHFSGWSNAQVGDKDKFYVFGFTGHYSRWIGKRSALNAGTEIILDYSRRELIESEGNSNSFVQAGALIGHEFWLGKVTFAQQLGVYYFNDYRINDDIYQRYFLSYSFTDKFEAGFGLKAHLNVADFFDLRVAYRL
ncbi:MAG: acyloxyacyl hydrolase [Psychroflexus sp.]|nr:acyloxyacyl hydrolase [Psychroflexus sp.]